MWNYTIMDCKDVVLHDDIYSEYFATINGHHGCIVSQYIGDTETYSQTDRDSVNMLQILYNVYTLSEIYVIYVLSKYKQSSFISRP